MKFQYYKPGIPAHMTQLEAYFLTNEQTMTFKNNLLELWSKETDRLLVAIKGKNIVGAAWLRKESNMIYIKYIQVNTPCRGVGRKMIEFLKNEQEVLECRAVYEAKGFWHKLGFSAKDNYGARFSIHP
ncbi:GNAT family N-acetyltransferase [Desulforamulus aquiferis]|uniref:GNAT family N-acetyltransferase n=1 Tax=Desulforamulus aquiferis TaxID=1397668 RepID=A0AAW7Z919_9FIRM|nr:GNAT family N-acetyltransferase [Desulforamulus aquiferis]MDO7786233.1 GNAT family N-acetyltransferase [Desulforamulus aquiferis]